MKSSLLNKNADIHIIVLFHGICSTPLEFSSLKHYLTENGFNVVTPTIKGYSHGEGPSSNWEDWSTDAVGIVKEIALNNPNSKISVGGISMGAIIAMAVAQNLDEIYSLILLSAILKPDGWSIPWYRSLIPLGIFLGLGDKIKYPEQEPFGVKNPQMRALIKRNLKNKKVSEAGGDAMSIQHLYQGSKLCQHITKHLSEITANTLIIQAIDDEIGTIKNTQTILDSINSKNVRVIYLGNSYHMITVDNERETVNFEIAHFLETANINQNNIEDLFNSYGFVSPELQRYLKR
jgi:carboxylesterase